MDVVGFSPFKKTGTVNLSRGVPGVGNVTRLGQRAPFYGWIAPFQRWAHFPKLCKLLLTRAGVANFSHTEKQSLWGGHHLTQQSSVL
jgi:hypothetical protein